MEISLAGNGFVAKAEGSVRNGSFNFVASAHRYPFRKGRYRLMVEDKAGPKAFAGTLPELGSLLIREPQGKEAMRLVESLAKAICDPAPLFAIKRSFKEEEHTRFLTTKELAVLTAIDRGITESADIARIFGISKARVMLGKLELNSSGFICTEWDGDSRRLRLSETGKKFLEKASGEKTVAECRRWLDFRTAPDINP